MNILPPAILFLPLAAAVAITLFTRRDQELSAKLSIGAVVGSFLLGILFVIVQGWRPEQKELISAWPWLEVDPFHVDFGWRLDPLSLMMMLIVTGVGSAIHIFSYGYMQGDRGRSRYFAGLSLFTFSMLGVVFANNFLQLFIFWELVGVSSYLLIGFWFERPSAADAAKKAFLTNRLGDFGFLTGILLVWSIFGSLNFSVQEAELARNPLALGSLATAAGLLLFCGAVGKSAQFPLHVWLPDAMEGPTPVSALIHAATMVAAGVYMLCRIFFLLNAQTLVVIAWTGGVTALLAALMAVQQNDIKRVLAYSTLSQLGYMIMAVGLSGPSPAMFHLTTHAFFKALLFLGAGSVIHALHQQDIWQMGGLRRRMPTTFWTFFFATLALCGVPPLSGFFSKDAILAQAYDHNPVLFGVGVLVAVLTVFYMFRLLLVVFFGPERSDLAAHAHESPAVMTWPLLLLAVPTVLAGFWGIEEVFASQLIAEGGQRSLSFVAAFFAPFSQKPAAAFFSIFASIAGFSAACAFYWRRAEDPLPWRWGRFSSLLRHRFYLDEIYQGLIACTQDALAAAADAFDRWIISGLMVRGIHGTTELFGRALRLTQTGSLQTYAFWFAAGVALLLFLALR